MGQRCCRSGLARLGGISLGVIGVETRTVENLIPASPANPNSAAPLIQDRGQFLASKLRLQDCSSSFTQ
nr:AIF_HP1_G0030780.mRNA.1.CDS.1 [Saccharomyces cerevisiae]